MVSCLTKTQWRGTDATSQDAKAAMRDMPPMVYSRSPSDRQAEDLRQTRLPAGTASPAMRKMEPEEQTLLQSHLFVRENRARQGSPCPPTGKLTAGHPSQSHRLGAAQRCHCQNNRRGTFGHSGLHHRANHPPRGENIGT